MPEPLDDRDPAPAPGALRRKLVPLFVLIGIAATVVCPPWADFDDGGRRIESEGFHSILGETPRYADVDVPRLSLQIALILAVGGILWVLLPGDRRE